MKSILNFESNVYSEELFAGLSEADYAEVMEASAADYEGYGEWSTELEQGERVMKITSLDEFAICSS